MIFSKTAAANADRCLSAMVPARGKKMETIKIKVDQTKVARGHQGRRGTVAFSHRNMKRRKTRGASFAFATRD